MSNEETITVSKKSYEQLVKDSEFLEALRAAGVDNWVGFDHALEMIEEDRNE